MMIAKIQQIIKYVFDYRTFRTSSNCNSRFSMHWKDIYPCLNENSDTTPFDAHYIYHPAWAARIIARTKPAIHVDISSTLHFCSILSAFVPVKFYDYRPADLKLSRSLLGIRGYRFPSIFVKQYKIPVMYAYCRTHRSGKVW